MPGFPPRKNQLRSIFVSAALLLGACLGTESPVGTTPGEQDPEPQPPFGGTIFVSGDIIRDTDSTTLVAVEGAGRGFRSMFDRRVGNWVNENAWIFLASFASGAVTEVQVNPEFDSLTAATLAREYAGGLGRLPQFLSDGVDTLVIHDGLRPWGGAPGSVLIHEGQSVEYRALRIVEETLVHEAVHAVLDAPYARSTGWVAAQDADGNFISTYARDNPIGEDLAETIPMWLAWGARRDRMGEGLAAVIEAAIPARLAFLDAQRFDLAPLDARD